MDAKDIKGDAIKVGDTVHSGQHSYIVKGFGTMEVFGRGGARQTVTVILDGTGDLVETPAFAVRKG